MNEASNNQFELEKDAELLDAQSDDKRAASTPSHNGSASEFSSDDSSLLTKVANLLDDVTESDPYPERSLDPTMPYNDRTGNSQSTGESPSLNSTWRPASSSTQDSKPSLTPDSPPETDPKPSQQFRESSSADALVSEETERVSTQAPPKSTDAESVLEAESALDVDAALEPDGGDNISLKGRGDGVAVELGSGDWDRMMARLDTRLEQAASFFRGGQVSLNVGQRPLVETELDQVCGILQKYGLAVGIIRTGSDRTFQAAINLGLAANMENASGESMTEATFSASNLGGQTHFVYRGTLRSGQVLQRRESILIIGDVNPGGHVISAGDIMVWGRLKGVAHAGADGNLKVVVGALQLEATQLRIADNIAIDDNRTRGRRKDTETVKTAEVAYIVDGKLVVRPWQEARRGLRSVLRNPS